MSSSPWNLARPEQLGSLDGPPGSPYAPAEVLALRAAAARVLVGAAGADLVFVGRSLEPLQCYLEGLRGALETGWRVRTLNVSLLGRRLSREEGLALRPLLGQAGLCPRALVGQDRRAVLVDVVASGASFAELHAALCGWARAEGLPAATVRRRVGWIGLLRASGGQRAPWRWQAQETFLNARPGRAISVLLPASLWHRLAETDHKVAQRCPPERWGLPEPSPPLRTPERLQALRQMRALWLRAGERPEREAFVRALVEAGGLRVPEVRHLISRLRHGTPEGAPPFRARLPQTPNIPPTGAGRGRTGAQRI